MMQLSSPYALPYEVAYNDGPLMSAGRDVRVEIVVSAGASSAAVDAFDSLILPFQLLASTGALAGESIKPWASTIVDKQGPFLIEGNVVGWVLCSCMVDARSMTVLAQMLLSVYSFHPFARISFTGAGGYEGVVGIARGVASESAYPAASRDLGYPIFRDSEVGREVVVRATFDVPLTDGLCTRMDAELFSWAAGLLSGAYGIAPIAPDECIATVDEEVCYGPTELTWALSRFSAHPAALDGLANVFASISSRIARVTELTIE